MNRVNSLLVAACTCIASASISAETVTVNYEQAVERALKTDHSIKEQIALVNVARSLVTEVEGSDDIIFDINAFVGITTGHDGGFFDNNGTGQSNATVRDDLYDLDSGLSPWFNIQATLIKPLYTFGKIEHFKAAAEQGVEVAKNEVRLKKAEVIGNVAKAYFGYLAARDNRYLLEDAKKKLEAAEETAEELFDDDTSEISEGDVFALKAGIALINKLLAQATAYEKIAYEGLKLLTGLEDGDDLEVADRRSRPLELPEMSVDEAIKKAIENRPEMAQLKAGLAARSSLVEARRAETNPNIYAGVVGTLAYSPGRDTLDNPYLIDPFNNYAATPIVGIKWDFQSGVSDAKIQRAEAELDALKAKGAFAGRGIPFQVREAHIQVNAMHEMQRQMLKASKFSRKAMTVNLIAFQAGTGEPSKLIEALRNYLLAYSDYLLTVNDYNQQVITLRKVIGDY